MAVILFDKKQDNQVVDCLTHLLERAKAGEITGVVVVFDGADEVSTTTAGDWVYTQMLGGIALLQHSIIHKWDEEG